MPFNQELIQKARKGEIAIKNDGTKDQLCEVLSICCPQYQGNPSGTAYVYEVRNGKWFAIGVPNESNLPAHSVKDFLMPDTKEFTMLEKTDTIIATGTEAIVQPRTYKVTRQQMKEIWEVAPCQGAKNKIVEMTTAVFDPFGIEAELNKTEVGMIVDQFDEPLPDLLKLVFTPYFHIPEGEPVLVRDLDNEEWKVFISDGEGCVYFGNELGGSSIKFNQIIPFTKNPPK